MSHGVGHDPVVQVGGGHDPVVHVGAGHEPVEQVVPVRILAACEPANKKAPKKIA